jgi:lysosomal Pro-X carboxypeptidase
MSQEEPYFPTTGVTDMFWDQGPFDLEGIDGHCQQAWGVTPRQGWMVTQHGGYNYR